MSGLKKNNIDSSKKGALFFERTGLLAVIGAATLGCCEKRRECIYAFRGTDKSVPYNTSPHLYTSKAKILS